jgi:hypothetical protein
MRQLDGRSLIVAVPAAFATSIATALGVFQLVSGQSHWIAEAIATFFAAAVWMLVGLKLSPRSSARATVLFLAGTATAWFLSRGIVHSVSPYYGLTALASAVIGAALVWTVVGEGTRARVLSLAVPSLTLVLVALSILSRPHLGLTRTLSQADGDDRKVHITYINDSIYAWTADPLRTEGTVQVELDPGSGASVYRLQEVADTATRTAVCERFAHDTQSWVASEVDEGSIPAFVTRIGFREADCRTGHLWVLVRDSA